MVETFNDSDKVEIIDQSGANVLTCLIETRPKEKMLDSTQRLLEFNFSKVQINKKRAFSQSLINHVLPRFELCDMKDTMLEIKKKIFRRIRLSFKKSSKVDFNDEWINNNLILQIKDNCPEVEVSKMITRKAACEFCGDKHNIRNDICDIKTKKFKKDGNSMEAASKITLQDLYDQIKYERDLKFEVLINIESMCNFKALAANFKQGESADDDNSSQKNQVIQLENCFKEFGAEELLTGADQWYCSKCKEHRDIHKKLELFRIPKVLIVQIKRFQSKKSANTGKSGFFNLAYAQICQQEKVDEYVEFPVEGLDIKSFVKSNCDLRGISTKYDLYGIVNHFGSLNGGHYTAACKGIDGSWYNFNDSSVSSLSGKRIKSEAAYVLFYRRRPDSEPSSLPTQVKTKKKRQSEETSSQASTQASQQVIHEKEESKDDAYIYELD